MSSRLLAFGGGSLTGGAPLRFAHIDEAGTSRDEKLCVVAGVVSHPDAQWLSINQHLIELADELAPPEDREGIVFHAKDIWHGTKKFHRDKWCREKRIDLLKRICRMPVDFAMPVIAGAIDKADHKWGGEIKPGSEKWEAQMYSLAFGLCVIHFEYVMRELCGPNEVGTVIAEDVPNMRRYAKWGYDHLRDKDVNWDVRKDIKNYMPIERIVEQPLFSNKTDSSILQIADTVAFVLGRRLNGHTDVQELLDLFSDQLIILPHQQ